MLLFQFTLFLLALLCLTFIFLGIIWEKQFVLGQFVHVFFLSSASFSFLFSIVRNRPFAILSFLSWCVHVVLNLLIYGFTSLVQKLTSAPVVDSVCCRWQWIFFFSLSYGQAQLRPAKRKETSFPGQTTTASQIGSMFRLYVCDWWWHCSSLWFLASALVALDLQCSRCVWLLH